MTITLKEQHRITRLRRLNESTRVVTVRMLQERKNHAIVMEAFNKKKFAEAAAVLKKLQDIDFGQMEYFKQAVQRAMGDVNDALGGTATVDAFSSRLGKIVNAAQSKLSNVVRNPIPNALAFASALEQAFEHAEVLIQRSFSGDLVNGLKSGKIPQEKVLALSPRKLVGKNANSLENALTQAFAPEGILAKLGLTWKKRYLDPAKAAVAIMDAPLGDVIKAARSFKQGPQMSDIAHELSSSDKGTDQTQQGGGAAGGQPTGENPEHQQVKSDTSLSPDDIEELVFKIAGKTNVSSKDVESVVNMLLKNGMLSVNRK